MCVTLKTCPAHHSRCCAMVAPLIFNDWYLVSVWSLLQPPKYPHGVDRQLPAVTGQLDSRPIYFLIWNLNKPAPTLTVTTSPFFGQNPPKISVLITSAIIANTVYVDYHSLGVRTGNVLDIAEYKQKNSRARWALPSVTLFRIGQPCDDYYVSR